MTWQAKIIQLFDIAQLVGVYLDAEIEEPGSDYTRDARKKLNELYEAFCQWRDTTPYLIDEIKQLLGEQEKAHKVQTSLVDHDGLGRLHEGTSGLTATSLYKDGRAQVWFEFDFDSRDEAIFLIGGLLMRVAEASKDQALINEAFAWYVSEAVKKLESAH